MLSSGGDRLRRDEYADLLIAVSLLADMDHPHNRISLNVGHEYHDECGLQDELDPADREHLKKIIKSFCDRL